MKNIDDFLTSLEKHQMFVLVKKKDLLENCGSRMLGWRNDGIGSRLAAYVNLVRLSKKLKKEFTFYWDLRSDKDSPSYPNNLSTDIDYYLPNLKNIKFFNSRNQSISKKSITEWKIIITEGENKKKVLKDWCKIVSSIFIGCKVEKKKLFKNYDYGLHVRIGDLEVLTTRTNQDKNYFSYREAFYLGKCYPEIFWTKIANNLKKKFLVSSSNYKKVKKLFSQKKNILYMDNFTSKSQNETYNFLFDIVSVSQVKNIICSIYSGSGLILSCLTSNKVYSPEKFLKIEDIFFEFHKICQTSFIKHNSSKLLIQHNIQFFLSKIIILKDKFFEYFKTIKY
ncbi:hypothetical protein N9O63_03700 [Candidatus Pelagibacter sp.]|nr:hypothetical protein [Candidatus Pelagibacter sp.]